MLFDFDNAGQSLSGRSSTIIKIFELHISISLLSVIVCSTAICICQRRELASITFSASTYVHITRGGCYSSPKHPPAPACIPVLYSLANSGYPLLITIISSSHTHVDVVNPRFFRLLWLRCLELLAALCYTRIRTGTTFFATTRT